MSFDNGINGNEVLPETEVAQNEEASLQDTSNSFDESNTEDEEYDDSEDDQVGELNFDVDYDRINEVLLENESIY